jgi:molybdenum cofactor guanylyltransferase
MGFNKALLKVNGQPLIRLLVDRIRPLTETILISSNDLSIYGFLGCPVIPDRFHEHGPLAGFHAAMLQHVSTLYLVLACDLPSLQVSFLRTLISLSEGFDAAIPRTTDGLAHPLCAVYRRTCLPFVERALERGDKRFVDAFLSNTLLVRWISPDEGHFMDQDLANINTPEDLHRLGIRSLPESA